MLLLTFAHRPEAKAFLGHFKRLKSHPRQKNLYISPEENLGILIAGEGFLQAAMSLTQALAICDEINYVLNMGVAGALINSLNVGEIVEGKTIYLGKDAEAKKMEFKSFPLKPYCKNLNSFDIVTSERRALSQKDKSYFSHFGELVDREAWGLAQAASMQNITMSSVKIVSDELNDEEFCQIVKESAQKFSEDLLAFFLENTSSNQYQKKVNEKSELEHYLSSHPQLFLTTAQKNLLKKYSKKIKLSEQMINDIEQIISDINSKRPKDLSKAIFEYIEEKYSPVTFRLSRFGKREILKLSNQNIKFSLDPLFETSAIYFSGKISSEKELDLISSTLNKLPVEKWESVVNGDDLV